MMPLGHSTDREEWRAQLRSLILETLGAQGFLVEDGRLLPPRLSSKDDARRLHVQAVAKSRQEAESGLRRQESRLLSYIAEGTEVRPEAFAPRLVEVERHSEGEALFRYARLHWSIPTSRGYGRRLRFLVIDESNNKLVGLIGLCDPVYALHDRDGWIGWSATQRRERLRLIMDAYVLGAVPPYSSLLVGKLVALLAASNEVRHTFLGKYANRQTLISARQSGSGLAMLTTASALGRSSIYNRLKYRGRLVYVRAGATQGTGELVFSNGIYTAMRDYALQFCTPTARHAKWGGGGGFRNRREVIKKCLADVGLSSEWNCHGVKRDIYVVPLAANAAAVLRGEEEELAYFDHPATELASWFRERWFLPRASTDRTYESFARESYRLWG
ncbi:MAG TPA: Druantia anti-phage system protein DruA [Candidatus Limnocylindrales bacterium]|nr:Druantia anti-phage system protein DruA [Candidatus Limnocylindrales bacterium]